MKKSIFTKYISAFLLIIFISFFVLTLIISSMTIRSENTQKITIAENTATYITEYLVSEFSSFMIPTNFEQFVTLKYNDISNMIDILSKNAEKMTIFITNPSGRILISTNNTYTGSIEDSDVLARLTADTGSKLYTDMDGMLDRKYGVLVTPFQYHQGGEYAGALIVCYSAGTLNELTVKTVRTIILRSTKIRAVERAVVRPTQETVRFLCKAVCPKVVGSVAKEQFAVCIKHGNTLFAHYKKRAFAV